MDVAAARGVPQVYVHAITDGRDVSPHQAADLLAALEAEWAGKAAFATVVGRYYGMDRDKRVERTELAGRRSWTASARPRSASEAVRSSYAAGVTDEFVEPVVLGGPERRIQQGDAAFFFNFRRDRARRSPRPAARLQPAGDHDPLRRRAARAGGLRLRERARTLADVLEEAGTSQFHVAETEKHAHVTYFFNGGVEAEHAHEQRALVPSPRDVDSTRSPG